VGNLQLEWAVVLLLWRAVLLLTVRLVNCVLQLVHRNQVQLEVFPCSLVAVKLREEMF
jgi:hypothetical protein